LSFYALFYIIFLFILCLFTLLEIAALKQKIEALALAVSAKGGIDNAAPP
jgi:hypothetical protein